MTAQPETATASEPDQTAEEKIQQLRELYADAPEVGKQRRRTYSEKARPRLWGSRERGWNPLAGRQPQGRSRSSP